MLLVIYGPAGFTVISGEIMSGINTKVLLLFISLVLFISVALRSNESHGLLILEVSRSHTTTHHSRKDSSGRVISSSQRPLPDNTQHSQQTSMPPVGFEPTISTGERRQTYALDRAATGTGLISKLISNLINDHPRLFRSTRHSG